MANLLLKATVREATGRGVEKLRENNLLPAVLYGRELTNQNLAVNYRDFAKVFQTAGESAIVDLQIGEAPAVPVLIQDVQYHPLRQQAIHADFYQVRMDEKLTANIPLTLVGEAPAVKEQGAIFFTSLETIEVKCLPADLPKEVVVDLSSLKNFGDRILVKDLPLGDKVEVLSGAELTVVSVAEPRAEEVEVKVEAPVVEGAAPVEGAEGGAAPVAGAEAAGKEGKAAKK
ncbi:MAG: 50S ribosomal protein L25 [Patescibacteria group bacterium]|jgi:large subunit ribosomal protein L25